MEMTREQAAMILDPDSSEEAMEEIKRLSGYSGEEIELKVIRDACRVAVKVLRFVSNTGPLTIDSSGWTDEEVESIKKMLHECSTIVQIPESILSASPAHIDRKAWAAEWIEDGECDHKPYRVRDAEKWKKYKCSKCGYKAGRRISQKYCPSCGRAMTPDAMAELEKRLRG